MDTVGNLIDKLSIVNIRIWFAEDIKRNKGATDKQLADACRVTNIANSQRNDLIQEIDELLNAMISTGELQRLYKQGATKMYGREIEVSDTASANENKEPAPNSPSNPT